MYVAGLTEQQFAQEVGGEEGQDGFSGLGSSEGVTPTIANWWG